MINPVNNNYILNPFDGLESNSSRQESTSFVDLLKNSIAETNDLAKEAEKVTTDFALGRTDNLHDVTIASEKASTALNMTLAVQGKVVDAYQEIMRLQI